MRFVAHIRRENYTIARASIDNQEGDTPEVISARAMEALTRDLKRTNHDTYLLDTEEKKQRVKIYEILVNQYGNFCAERLSEHRNYFKSIIITDEESGLYQTFRGIAEHSFVKYISNSSLTMKHLSDNKLRHIEEFLQSLEK